MKIHFVTEGSLNEFWDRTQGIESDVIVFGFNGLENVYYERELEGDTGKLEDLAIMSRELSAVVVSGCYTFSSCNRKRKSAAIADKGRILGVSDMLCNLDGSEFTGGAHLRVYETSVGRIGLIVGEDLFFPEVVKTLSDCDADLALCIFEDNVDFLPQVLMRAFSFCYGLDICLCGSGVTQIASTSGELVLSSPAPECDAVLDCRREYHLVGLRRRGFRREIKNSF